MGQKQGHGDQGEEKSEGIYKILAGIEAEKTREKG